MNQIKIGTVIELDPAGERIIKAIAQADWPMLTASEFEAYRREARDWGKGEAPLPRSGYHEALSLIRKGETSAAAVADALGEEFSNGAEGDIWKLFDLRLAIHRADLSVTACAEDERAQTDEEAAAEHADALERLARETAPPSDGPDDIEEREDGTLRVTSTGLADITGLSYASTGRWFSRSGLPGQVYLGDIERMLTSQLQGAREHVYLQKEELARALKGVRRYLVEHAGKRAAAADQVHAGAARYGLIKALVSARAVLAADEISVLASHAVRTGRNV